MKTVQKTTLQFLSDLKKNNNRDWFSVQKERFKEAQKNILDFTQSLIFEITKFDSSIKGLRAEQCIFRIYKDVRFSKDKTPYKTNFGSFMCPNGRKSGQAGYYIHIQPGSAMIGGGLYHPEPEKLSKIRQDIDANPKNLIKILKNTDFKKYFQDLKGEQLKTIPRGFDKDHPQKELLRYKDFLGVYNLKDKEILSESFFNLVLDVFKKLKPLTTYLNKTTA